jgi:hypothetical protein
MKITINYTYKQSIKRVTYLKSIFLTKDDRQWVDSKVLPDQEDTPKRQGFSLYCLHLNVDGWYAKLQAYNYFFLDKFNYFPRQAQVKRLCSRLADWDMAHLCRLDLYYNDTTIAHSVFVSAFQKHFW